MDHHELAAVQGSGSAVYCSPCAAYGSAGFALHFALCVALVRSGVVAVAVAFVPASTLDSVTKPSNIADLRREYALQRLDENDVKRDPFDQFAVWFEEAVKAQLIEPNAMILATATATGKPAARTVLLKGYDARGLLFFTNYNSRKGAEIADNPQASLLFLWLELERQVRIEGKVEKATPQESDDLLSQSAVDSRLGAWASPQSRVMRDREAIEARFAEAARLHGDDPNRPPYWGGYRLIPIVSSSGRDVQVASTIASSTGKEDNNWVVERLAP